MTRPCLNRIFETVYFARNHTFQKLCLKTSLKVFPSLPNLLDNTYWETRKNAGKIEKQKSRKIHF